MDESNTEEVTKCVNTPPVENAVRTAASNLYSQLRPKDTDTFSKDAYYNRVKQFTQKGTERKFLNSTGKAYLYTK